MRGRNCVNLPALNSTKGSWGRGKADGGAAVADMAAEEGAGALQAAEKIDAEGKCEGVCKICLCCACVYIYSSHVTQTSHIITQPAICRNVTISVPGCVVSVPREEQVMERL